MDTYIPLDTEYWYYKNFFKDLMFDYYTHTCILEQGYQIKPFNNARIDTGMYISNGQNLRLISEAGITLTDRDKNKVLIIPQYLFQEFYVKLMADYFESKDIYETLYLLGERGNIIEFKRALKKFTGNSDAFYDVKSLWWKLGAYSVANLEDRMIGLTDRDYEEFGRHACDVYANIFFDNHEIVSMNHLCMTWADVVNNLRSLAAHKSKVYLDAMACSICNKEGGEYVYCHLIEEGCTFGSLENHNYFQVSENFIPSLTIFFLSRIEPYKNIVNFYKMVHQILSDLDAELLARSIREMLHIDVDPESLYNWVGLTRDTIDVSRKDFYNGCI